MNIDGYFAPHGPGIALRFLGAPSLGTAQARLTTISTACPRERNEGGLCRRAAQRPRPGLRSRSQAQMPCPLTTARPAVTVNLDNMNLHGADHVQPEKNLHAAIPADLLAKAQAAAEQEHISLDELVSDAMERRLNRREFEEVLAFGKRHTRKRGLKPSDVEDAVDAVRDEDQERGR